MTIGEKIKINAFWLTKIGLNAVTWYVKMDTNSIVDVITLILKCIRDSDKGGGAK